MTGSRRVSRVLTAFFHQLIASVSERGDVASDEAHIGTARSKLSMLLCLHSMRNPLLGIGIHNRNRTSDTNSARWDKHPNEVGALPAARIEDRYGSERGV